MASVVQLCNMALSHIGSAARVTSLSPPDGSVEAGLCFTFYELARTELLEPGNWRFALKRADLASVTNDSTQWAYAYALPSDCMRALRVFPAGDPATVFDDTTAAFVANDQGSARFDLEGDVLRTNVDDATLLYTRDVTDTTKFTPSFTSALSYLLASYLAGPVVKGNEGAKLGDSMRQRALSIASMSATASANASHATHDFVPSSVEARA